MLLSKTRNSLSEKSRARKFAASRPPTLVKPVEIAVRIMRYLSQSGRAHTLTHIARHLGIYPSTCFNILRTLTASSMLEFDREAKTYAISAGVLDLAEGYLSQGGVLREAQLKMHDVAYEFGATTTLWRRSGDDRQVLVALVDGIADFRVHMRLGQRMPLLIGAVGRVMAAYSGLSEHEIRRRFAQLRWQGSLGFREYMTQTRQGAQRGWMVDGSNHVNGVVTVAAPVFATGRSVPMALAASMFDNQQKDTMRRLTSTIIATAGEISRYITSAEDRRRLNNPSP
jgi:DNA-binding IclR family transcriptional regulator